jgi:hypothetical protein
MMKSSDPNRKSILRQPILVTGAHRSGTTWVGKMLAASGQVGYISEPLNILHRPGVLISPTRYWYSYICPENEASYLTGLQTTLRFRYNLLAEIRALRSMHDLGRMLRDLSGFQKAKVFHLRPLLKDPFAFFSSPWFANRLGCRVVITVRHPAAFVSSLKRLGWPFDLRDLLDQPFLMRDFLEPYRSDIEQFCSDPQDMIGQNSLLWRIIYATAGEFKKSYPEFHLVRHEDLSLQPVKGFQSLYEDLELDFTPPAQQRILASSSVENPRELSVSSVHSVHLNSQANLENWKRRLTNIEIERIRRITENVTEAYYPETDWE